jgi:DNA-binding NarL/FixJ family response regulator
VRLDASTILAVLDAAYAPVRGDNQWLDGVIRALAHLWPEATGAAGYFVDMSKPDLFRAWGYRGRGALGGTAGRRRFDAWSRGTSLKLKRFAHRLVYGLHSQFPTSRALAQDVKRSLRAVDVPDMFGLTALDVSGRGATFALSLPRARRRRLPPQAADVLERLSVHLSGALRLRREEGKLGSGASRLSEREHQVVAGARLGHSNKMIAYELGLTPSTVSTLLTRAQRKLGVRDRLTLIRGADESSLPNAAARRLSPAEQAITRLTLAGLSNRAIAQNRQTSVLTVGKQLQSIYRKLGCSSRAELAAWASRVT